MAMTHDYMDYLNDKVEICPAGSQEELQAADVIADLMRQHDVEPNIEEFDAKKLGGTLPSVFFVFMFVGIVLVGIGVPLLTALGFVLAFVPAALFVLKYLGYDFISSLGPTTRSQNVVAFHGAEGPMVVKGNRPIVIVAHYDSPHVNPLYSTPVSRFVPLMWKVSKWCVLGVAACALFQVFGFLPSAFRRFMWVIGILGALPLIVLGASGVIEHFSDCTDGANDNKSGVAAMLGVLENVRPSGIESIHGSESVEHAVEAMRRAAEGAEARAAAAADGPAPEISYAGLGDRLGTIEPEQGADPFAAFGGTASAPAETEYEEVEEEFFEGPATKLVPGEVLGVRHGADIVRSLGMLPEGCDVEYVDPDPVEVPIPDSERKVVKRVVRRPVQRAAAASVAGVSAAVSGVAAAGADAPVADNGPDFGQEQEPDFPPLSVDAYTQDDDKPSPMDFIRGAAERVSSAVADLGSKISAKREEAREAAEAKRAQESQELGDEQPEDDGSFAWLGEEDEARIDEPVEQPAEQVAEQAVEQPAVSEPVIDVPSVPALDETSVPAVDESLFATAPVPESFLSDEAPAEVPAFEEESYVFEEEPAYVPEVAQEFVSAPAEPLEVDSVAEADVAPAVEPAEPSLYEDAYAPELFTAPEPFVAEPEPVAAEAEPVAVEPEPDHEPVFEAEPATAQAEPAPSESAPAPVEPESASVAEPPAPVARKTRRGFFLRDEIVKAPVYEDLPVAEYEEIPYVPAADARAVSGGNIIPFGDESEDPAVESEFSDAPLAEKDEAAQADAPRVPKVSFNFDGLEDGETLNPDNTGLTAETDLDVETTGRLTVEHAPKPPAPDDPEWGKTSFRPAVNPASRVSLFDLPDPSSKGDDPFGTDPNAPKVPDATDSAARSTGRLQGLPVIGKGDEPSAPASVADDFADADYEEFDDEVPGQDGSVLDRLKGLFGKKGPEDGSDADDASQHGSWKGGAATRAGLRVVEGDAAPNEDDLRDEILALGHDALVSHDIWFVALGASDCDHAGMRAFLAEHRKQIRGSFVINLDSVAAGDLTLLTHEGLLVTRRADRRMLRMLTTVANDLHVPQGRAKYDWASTDATPAMMLSMRGVTLMGTDGAGMRALSHTPDDVAENTVPEQAVAAAEIVTELIRRS